MTKFEPAMCRIGLHCGRAHAKFISQSIRRAMAERKTFGILTSCFIRASAFASYGETIFKTDFRIYIQ